jgi:hypothetical protein
LRAAITEGLALPDKYRSLAVDAHHHQVNSQVAKLYGIMKVLGSYIGSNEYVKCKLEDVILQYTKIKERLVNFPIAQQRMMLFRYCFSSKPVHLLRTIPAKLTESFVSRFVGLQKELLGSFVNQEVDNALMILVALPIEQGGLGFLNYQDIHSIAHIASVFGTATFSTIFKDHLNSGIANINVALGPFVTELFQQASILTSYLGLPETTSLQNIVGELDTLRIKAVRDRSTFQSALYVKVCNKKERRDEIEQLLKDADPTECRLMSYRNTLNNSAGAWLRTPSRHKQFCLSNDEFCVALCLRYHLVIRMIRGTERQCACCKTKNCKPDPYGHHFASACLKDLEGENGSHQSAQPHAVHDVIRRTLYQLSTQAMVISAVQEPANLLRVATAEHQVRPDLGLVIPSRNMQHVTYAVDVGLVCPFKGSKMGNIEVDHNVRKPHLTNDKRAIQKKKDKDLTYKTICKNKGYVFVPFIMNTTGKIHKQGLRLLRRMAEHASELRNIPAETLFKYYIRVMNFTLFSQVTRLITLKAIGHSDPKTARQTSANTLRSVNRLVHELTEQPYVSAHTIFPDM